MKWSAIAFGMLLLAASVAHGRGSGGRRSFGSRGGSSSHRGGTFRGGFSGHQGSSHGSSFHFGFGSGRSYRRSRSYYYPSFGISYYSYGYPYYYSWPSTYYYPSTYSYGYTYPTYATTYPATTATYPTTYSSYRVPARPPQPQPQMVQGWYHPTYGFWCQCHGYQKKSLPNHSYQYDTSRDARR